jgi:hypothetical protein
MVHHIRSDSQGGLDQVFNLDWKVESRTGMVIRTLAQHVLHNILLRGHRGKTVRVRTESETYTDFVPLPL